MGRHQVDICELFLIFQDVKNYAGGRMSYFKWIIVGLALPVIAIAAQAQPVAENAETIVAPLGEPRPDIAPTELLLAGTSVVVALDAELSTQASLMGDSFAVTVVNDVLQNGVIVIPKGTRGRGEVTFVTKKGTFGKPGIIAIALRDMELNGRQVPLDGRFREEGGNNNAATAATMFAVGIVAGLVKGKTGVIPAGRELKGRTGEDIIVAQPAAPQIELAAQPPAPSTEAIETIETPANEPEM